jgi:hypothetical protein
MSNETNGPPLRVKAIDPDTGRESDPGDISAYCHAGDVFDLTNGGFNLPGMRRERPILSQSTGLTDGDGEEVYSLDVLARDDGETYRIHWSGSAWRVKTSEDDTWPQTLGEFLSGGDAWVAGNAYTPALEIERAIRARLDEGRYELGCS